MIKVALFSDIITWIGEGEIAVTFLPDALVDKNDGWKTYTNLELQGGTTLLETHPEFAAAYVQNDSVCVDPVDMINVKFLSTPISTEGA